MSFERYIELLQMLITMTDPDDPNEVLCAGFGNAGQIEL